jgi:hypothetical protein
VIDALATLRPDTGLARDCVLTRIPDSPLWSVTVDVGLAETKPTVSGAPRFDRVGATAFRRADAVIRGAGDATMRPVGVVVRLVLAPGVERVRLVPDQRKAPG